jgi:hypothetical protein
MWKPDLWAPVRELARCHVTSQFGARRNALLACTALARRRRERDDVEHFLATTKRLGSGVLRDSGQPDVDVDLKSIFFAFECRRERERHGPHLVGLPVILRRGWI